MKNSVCNRRRCAYIREERVGEDSGYISKVQPFSYQF